MSGYTWWPISPFGSGGRSPSPSKRASTTVMLSGPPRSLASAISLSHAASRSRSRVATVAISSFFTVPVSPSEHNTKMSPLRTSWCVRSTLTRASGRLLRASLLLHALDALRPPVGEPLRRYFPLGPPRPHQLLVARLGRHLARELAGGRAAHAVGDDEQRAPLTDLVDAHRRLERRLPARQIRDQEAVFVVVARPAQVGLREDLDLDRLGRRASEHVQRRH